MSTDLVVPEHHPNGRELATLRAATPTVTSLVQWEAELVAAGSLAQKLCVTSFVPEHFRGKPAETAAAILTGFELGLSPMAALRAIFIIKGTPGMYAKTMVAIVQAQGHEVWIPVQTATRVVVCGKRRGSDKEFTTEWTPDRVKIAKLDSNSKYRESPQQMMTARGQAEICRQVAADALHGVPYAVEELEDMPAAVDASFTRVTAAEILGPPAAIEAPEPEAAAPAVPEQDDPVLDRQRKRMFALFGQEGYTNSDADAMRRFIGNVIGREIASRKDMTGTEVAAVIDALEHPDAPESDAPEPAEGEAS